MEKSRHSRLPRTYGLVLAFATFGYFVRWISGQFTPELNATLFFTSFGLMTVTWEFLRFIDQRLNKVYPYEQSIAGRIALQLGISVLFALFIRFIIFRFLEPFLPFRLDGLFLAATWAIYVFLAVGLNSIFFVNFFIDRWRESIRMAERLEKEKTQVQFDNLKNQLNPHFLFNALTSLNSLITENQPLAQQFLQHMSKVYRYVLQNKDKNFVSLQTELDFIKNYVFLAETRFGGALKIKFEISKEALETAIVPVTLQILIENAVKHNVIDGERPLTIEVFSSGDYLVVSNNLQKRKTVETSNKQGLDNLKSLYRFMTERPVLLESNEGRFLVKVPLL